MAVTNYLTYNGRIRGELTAGVRKNYLTDALGSVTATVDATGALENTYRHKPYGALLAKTGTGSDPRYLWTGDTGSRSNSLRNAEQYNRARHLSPAGATWISLDPVRDARYFEHLRVLVRTDFLVHPYSYARANPSTLRDPSGLQSESACISIRVPVTPTVSLGMQYCNWCFSCCQPGNWASRCWSLEGNASWRIAGVPWDNIGKEVRELGENLLRLLSGAAFGIGQCLRPERKCVPKSSSGDFEVCLSACGGMVSLTCCAGLRVEHGGSGFPGIDYGCSVAYGYCGLPNIALKLRCRTKQCT